MTVRVLDTGDLKQVIRATRQVADGKQLRKDLTSGFRQVLNPIRDKVKGAYRSAPSMRGKAGRRGGSLRGALARVTRTEIRTGGRLIGARIRVDGRRMPDGMRSLPAYYEGYKRPWRHPVFGDREVWVAQPARPLFDRTVEPHAADAQRAIDEVLADIRRKLERGTIP